MCIDLNSIDITLREIWEAVLNRKIGGNQDFFELGGDSLSMFSVLESVSDRINVVVSIEEFLDNSVFGDFALLIEQKVELHQKSQCDGV